MLFLMMNYVFSSLCHAEDDKPLSVAITTGTTSSAGALELESAMREQGFADSSPAFLGHGPFPHPLSGTGSGQGGYSGALSIQYRIRKPWSIGGIVSNAPTGSTEGYHDPDQYIFIDHTITSFAATASASYRGFRIGFGPALHIAKASANRQLEKHTKFGFVLDGGVQLPSRSRFFFAVDMQYRYVGRVTLGPFMPTNSALNPAQTLSAANVLFSHWFIGIGPGIRF